MKLKIFGICVLLLTSIITTNAVYTNQLEEIEIEIDKTTNNNIINDYINNSRNNLKIDRVDNRINFSVNNIHNSLSCDHCGNEICEFRLGENYLNCPQDCYFQ
jgi:hypothetical protein